MIFPIGYHLDSHLLASIANEGLGMYSFVPDGGFVGTTFVHALANTLSGYGMDARLRMNFLEGAR